MSISFSIAASHAESSDTNLSAPKAHLSGRHREASLIQPAHPAIRQGDLQGRARQIAALNIQYHPVDLGTIEFAAAMLRKRDRKLRMSAVDEQSLFLALNAAKQQLARGRGQLRLERPEVGLLKELEGYRDRATLIRRHLVEVFFKLAVSAARSFADSHQEMDDLVGQACLTLIRSVELFDPNRGCRFSSYATRAIRTELSRFVMRERKRALVSLDASDLNHIRDERSSVLERKLRGRLLTMLNLMLEQLEQREAHVVRSRFGLNDRPGACTLQSLADEYGVTRERVRQLERRALRKLREMADAPERQQAFEALADGD